MLVLFGFPLLEEIRQKKAKEKAKVDQMPKAIAGDDLGRELPVGSVGDGSLFQRASVSVAESAAKNIDQHSDNNVCFPIQNVGSLNEMDSGGGSDDTMHSIDDEENTSHRSLDFFQQSKWHDDYWMGKVNEPRSILSDLVTTCLREKIDSIQSRQHQ